jgi:hypothetical protein
VVFIVVVFVLNGADTEGQQGCGHIITPSFEQLSFRITVRSVGAANVEHTTSLIVLVSVHLIHKRYSSRFRHRDGLWGRALIDCPFIPIGDVIKGASNFGKGINAVPTLSAATFNEYFGDGCQIRVAVHKPCATASLVIDCWRVSCFRFVGKPPVLCGSLVSVGGLFCVGYPIVIAATSRTPQDVVEGRGCPFADRFRRGVVLSVRHRSYRYSPRTKTA